jgi:hypothetical protein
MFPDEIMGGMIEWRTRAMPGNFFFLQIVVEMIALQPRRLME